MKPGPPVQAKPRGKRAAIAAAQARAAEKRRAKESAALARVHVLVNPANLRPHNSYDTPDFVLRGWYVDRAFTCKSCGARELWRAEQQKWWYEVAHGDVWTVAVLCKPCRRREQARRAAARAVHLEGLARKGKQATRRAGPTQQR
jgi:hypothetical protein